MKPSASTPIAAAPAPHLEKSQQTVAATPNPPEPSAALHVGNNEPRIIALYKLETTGAWVALP